MYPPARACRVIDTKDAPSVFRKFPLLGDKVRLKCEGSDGFPVVYFDLPREYFTYLGYHPITGSRFLVAKDPVLCHAAPDFYGRSIVKEL